MPHKAFGIDWPIYRETETKASGRDKPFTLPKSPQLKTAPWYYWPPQALPFAHAWDLVEIVLYCTHKKPISPLRKLGNRY